MKAYRESFLYAGDRISWWPESFRQALGEEWSLFAQEYLATVQFTLIAATILYLVLSLGSYFYIFVLNRKKYLPEYERKMKGESLRIGYDIYWSLVNIFVESWLVSAVRIMVPRYGLVYYDWRDFGVFYFVISIFLHMAYDETLTYWVHRWMHTYPRLFELLHKVHHRSLDVTPFSGFAFHPFDAFAQALGTFTSAFFFPLHSSIILFFSVVTPVWAISIHDNVPALPFKLFLYATHHTIHHEPGRGQMSNYGKFTSIWDRIMKSYCDPDRIDYGWKQKDEPFKKLNKIYGEIVADKSSSQFPGYNKTFKEEQAKQK